MTDNAAAVPASMQHAPFKITVSCDTQASVVIDNGERRWRTLPLLNNIDVCKIAYCRTYHLSALCATHGTKGRHPHKCLRSASDEYNTAATGSWSSVVTGDAVGATFFSQIPWLMTVYELLSNGWSSVLVGFAKSYVRGVL